MTSTFLAAIAAALGAEPGLHSEWLYHPDTAPALVEVVPPLGAGTARLALLDAEGGLLVEPVEVRAGAVDLFRRIPEVRRLRRAAWLQMLAEGEPVGPALVIQPLLSRLVPVGREVLNPNGISSTEITGWRDETREPEPEPAPGTAPAPDDPSRAGPAPGALRRAWLADPAGDDRLFTGLRIYPDADVVLHTSLGAIRIALRPDEAPNTAWSFRHLCGQGFYRGVAFHRVVPYTRDGEPFVIQAGDPSGGGSGGPGFWLPLEPSGLAHDLGVVSMARDVDPDSAGSQFFVCLSRAGTRRLDGHYCAFGETVEGLGTIRAIASVELADVASGRPAHPPVIESAEIVPAPPRRPGAPRRPAVAPAPPIPPRPERVPR